VNKEKLEMLNAMGALLDDPETVDEIDEVLARGVQLVEHVLGAIADAPRAKVTADHIAKLCRMQYQSFLDAGFSDGQAFTLLVGIRAGLTKIS